MCDDSPKEPSNAFKRGSTGGCYGPLAFTMAVKRDARWSLLSDSAYFQAVS